MDTVPYCAFCLRANPPNVEFYKHVVGCSTELRHSFQSMLGYDFQLANFSICKPCWKLMQLVQDFRLRCFKANTLVERIGQGLQSEDGWFSVKNLATIESVRMAIKDQVQQIGRVDLEELRTTEAAVDNDLTRERKGDLVLTIELGEVKIESDAEIARDVAMVSAMDSSKDDDATFRHKEQLQVHLNVHESKTPYKCDCCKKAFACPKTRNIHQASCNKYILNCKHCDAQLPNNQRLVEHYRREHPGEQRHKCSQCDMRFTHRLTLLQHERRKHTAKLIEHTCPECGKQFSRERDLRSHIKYHQTRPHHCEICELRFMSKTVLLDHVVKCHPEKSAKEGSNGVTEHERTVDKLKAMLARRSEQKAEDGLDWTMSSSITNHQRPPPQSLLASNRYNYMANGGEMNPARHTESESYCFGREEE
ncbi:zinc finger protein 888-like [Culex pipiens pallens]|uniref:zinc finger protein 888-like n=1 Tax=Culex pipiens pallens TaxID=42434 RepID=UPI0019540A12|nr:zinc finger protein 888-like [Culex pipiens pallens]